MKKQMTILIALGAVLVGALLVKSALKNVDTQTTLPAQIISEVASTQEQENMPSTQNDFEHEDPSGKDFEIAPSTVKKRIESGEEIILLDVRTPEEYAEIHLQNAKLVSVEELSEKTLEAAGIGSEEKNKEIIIYCRSGARSARAHGIMQSLGYTNIKSIAGGIVHWQEDGYPFTETGGVGTDVVKEISADAQASPSLTFDRTSHDFGLIPAVDGVVETTFTLKNTGAIALEIGDISTSCGCTTAEIAMKSIPAGSAETITVRFDPNFHKEPQGQLTRTVFIPTNDPHNPEAEITILAEIQK